MSVIEAPLRETEVVETEITRQDLPEDKFSFEDSLHMGVPCECHHDLRGRHFVRNGHLCNEMASWRVVVDCQHRPRHAFNFCTLCKEAAISAGGIFNVVSL